MPEDFESETSDEPSSRMVVDPSYLSQLRELELELDKIRSQASAARLDARAAELELQIKRLSTTASSTASIEPASERPAFKLPELPRSRSPRPARAFRPQPHPKTHSQDTVDVGDIDAKGSVPLASWNDLRRRISSAETVHRSPSAAVTKQEFNSGGTSAGGRTKHAKSKQAGSNQAARPKSLSLSGVSPIRKHRAHAGPDQPAGTTESIQLTTASEQASERRRKPGAWLISAIVHAMVLALLAAFTLSRARPGDQIAIAGSVADTNEVAIESLEIEAAAMPETASQPTPSEVEFEVSDVGEIPISDLINDAQPAPPSPILDSMMGPHTVSAASLSMKSDSDAKIKFCGVEGGGNHFVYLVDSSASMGSAFDSARNALLESISILKPNQRFYVIFFDAESDYMRLSSPNQDEPRSAFATPQNKAALQLWAMKISMDRGRAPYDAIPFALELQPDVIFLLSDGEFPQKIEDLLRDTNRIDNLFGDEGPISIVHTIGYHSREGESRMRRIAKQNGGQYRYVPKP